MSVRLIRPTYVCSECATVTTNVVTSTDGPNTVHLCMDCDDLPLPMTGDREEPARCEADVTLDDGTTGVCLARLHPSGACHRLHA